MADSKITALTELTQPSADDLLAIVDDPGGTPVTKKVTRANLRRYIINATPKTANYTLTANDEIILANTTGGTFTITAPTAVGNTGKPWVIKKVAGTPSVIIAADGVETIDGSATYELVNLNELIEITSNGSNLIITRVYTA